MSKPKHTPVLTFDCDECTRTGLPVKKLLRPSVGDPDRCLCSQACRHAYEYGVVKERMELAAPAMLAALAAISEWLGETAQQLGAEDLARQVNDAIAKAEGRGNE